MKRLTLLLTTLLLVASCSTSDNSAEASDTEQRKRTGTTEVYSLSDDTPVAADLSEIRAQEATEESIILYVQAVEDAKTIEFATAVSIAKHEEAERQRQAALAAEREKERLAQQESYSAPTTSPAPTPAPAPTGGSVWYQLADCESHGEWTYGPHSTWGSKIYHGGLQFHPTTWTNYKPAGYPTYAYQASPSQQIAVAERVLASEGWGAWPACSRELGFR